MSQKDNGNLENEWTESHRDAEEVDRSDTWILARMDEAGNFLNDEVSQKAKEIKKMKEEVKEGILKVEVRVREGHEKTIHGVSLGEKNARVSITKVIQGNAKIPFPIGDEILTVQEAMGTFIAWPRNMIIAGNNGITSHVLAAKKTEKAHAKKMKKTYKVIEDVEPELVVQIGPNYPSAMKRLWTWAKEALSGGRKISFELRKEAFGFTKKQIMFLSDIYAVCSGGEMPRNKHDNLICSFLNEYVKKYKMVNKISFVDTGTIGAIGCGSAVQRSRELCTRFKDSTKGQHFLLSYNDVNHWPLTVVNPDTEVVYYMDPLKRRIANGEWVDVVDNAIKMYKEDLKKVPKKKVLWENMAGVPVHTGTKDCGLFVMQYMMEIIHDKELDYANKWLRRSNLVYTEDDINEIKAEFAKYFMKHSAS
ncbi:uncharacterized protein LOC141699833 [Apium graveolens]|uniref:uncharacterized protein LOC141699833 n=1 Tax=Apium graveolens TaxID=4045 RepID=UPI003D7AE450